MNHLRPNRYTCPECKGTILTREMDPGVTPMMVNCRATPGCKGFMQSGFYRGVAEDEKPTYEWYMPTREERKALSPEEQHHVAVGGLLLREIGA